MNNNSEIINNNNLENNNVAIKIIGLYKTYKETVLDNVNLEIYKNKFTAILGNSGSGKSTLLNIIGGIDLPTSGSIKIFNNTFNKDNQMNSKQRAENIGFVFQNHYLINELSVFENIECAARILHNNQIAKQLTIETLKRINIEHLANKYPLELSGGEQQRCAIARAIINKPKILLADEPTGNLDSNNAKKILDLFLQLKSEGVTILIATHSKMLQENSDYYYNIYNGKIIF
ncbi:MAG: ABC transporter ATP-binding protein [Rickettsiales bacterium]